MLGARFILRAFACCVPGSEDTGLHISGPAIPTGISQAERSRGKEERTPRPLSTPTHWDEGTLGVFAATVSSGYTLVLIKHKARVAEAAFFASGRDFGVCVLAVAIQVGAGRRTRGKAVGVEAVGRALQSYREEERRVIGEVQRDPRE